MKKELIQRLHKSFEDCAHQRDGVEYWLARELQELLVEQKRTNRLLQGIVYGAIGFALGLIVMQFLVRVRLF